MCQHHKAGYTNNNIFLLTHEWWHFALRQFGHRATDWDLKRRDVECSHVILTTSFIVIVDDVFSHIIVWTWIFNVGFSPPTVHNKHEHQYCGEEKFQMNYCIPINMAFRISLTRSSELRFHHYRNITIKACLSFLNLKY